MIIVNGCPLSLNHLILECNMARIVWNAVMSWFSVSWLLPEGVAFPTLGVVVFDWIEAKKTLWMLPFVATIWSICKEMDSLKIR